MSNKQLEKFEKKYKETLFNRISEIQAKNFNSISSLEKCARGLGQSNTEIPNACVTLNNKIIELANIFNEAGISIYVAEYEKLDIIGKSFVGEAVIYDLIDNLSEASINLKEYSDNLKEIAERKNKQLIKRKGPIRNIFNKIGKRLKIRKALQLSLNEDEQRILEELLDEYKSIDKKIWNYNLEENLLGALVKKIAGPEKVGNFELMHKFNSLEAPKIIERNVEPDLKKLKLEYLLPKLQQELDKEYKKDYNQYCSEASEEKNFKYDLAKMYNNENNKSSKTVEKKAMNSKKQEDLQL